MTKLLCPLSVTVDDGIELRYDEEEDLGQPLMFWRYACISSATAWTACDDSVGSVVCCRMWGTKKMGPPRRLKDKEKRCVCVALNVLRGYCTVPLCWLRYTQPSVCSRPSTVTRREREAMQEKVDKIKGQMREMKRWHSQQLLVQRSQGQLDSLVHQMSSHMSFGTLPRVRLVCRCAFPVVCRACER